MKPFERIPGDAVDLRVERSLAASLGDPTDTFETNPLLRRFDSFRPLSFHDREMLAGVTAQVRHVPAQTDLAREGDRPDQMFVVLEGFACRYKIVEGGKRQIVTYLVPGDICDAHMLLVDRFDHSIATLSDCRIAVMTRDSIERIFGHHPAIVRAMMWSVLVTESVSREWLANMGRRSPDKRIGHLLCELLVRLQAMGLAEDDRFAFPITQADLGDTMGLSTVHVNRTLQDLKEKGLIASKRWLFEVLDVERLKRFSDFDPSYLHFGQAMPVNMHGMAGPDGAGRGGRGSRV